MRSAVAEKLDVDKSNAGRRLRMAAADGYVRNLEDRPGRPGRWVVGDPLPEDVELLPTVAQLREVASGRATAADHEPAGHDADNASGCAVAPVAGGL
jgi:hypothetical protein